MSLSTTIKSIQDIMRKDVGVDGDAQRIGQLVWLLFLKIWQDREQELELVEDGYQSPLVNVTWQDSGVATPDPQPRWTKTRTRAQSRRAPARWSNQKARSTSRSSCARRPHSVRTSARSSLEASRCAGSRSSLASGSSGPLECLPEGRFVLPLRTCCLV